MEEKNLTGMKRMQGIKKFLIPCILFIPVRFFLI